MDGREDQIRSVELTGLLRTKNEQQDIPNRISGIYDILSSVSTMFSVAHVAHDILKLLANSTSLNEEKSRDCVRLVDLLVSRFSASFRPGPKDVMNLIRSAQESKADWVIGRLLLLLKVALRNQLGNPKNTFLIIADEFLPWVGELEKDVIATHLAVIRDIVGTMFVSPANMECLYGFIRAAKSPAPPAAESESTGRKRKSTDSASLESYVSHLFSGIGNNYVLATIVLSEFVGRENPLRDHDDDFAMFSHLLVGLSLDGKIELWRHMSSNLRVYRLRDEYSEKHRLALTILLEEITSNSINPGNTVWNGLETILSIDPWNMMDRVLPEIVARLPATGSGACLSTLFKTFAIKGSLTELVEKLLHERQLVFADFGFLQSSEIISEISGIDLVDSLCLLLKYEGPNLSTAAAIAESLLASALYRVPENLLTKACEAFRSKLSSLADGFADERKAERASIGRFMILLVDALRIVSLSHSLPLQSNPDIDLIERALVVIAKKCLDLRSAALIRLSLICDTEVSASELVACPDGASHVSEFARNSFENAFAIANRDWKDLADGISTTCIDESNFKRYPETFVPESFYENSKRLPNSSLVDGDVFVLLSKSKQLIAKYPRLIFTPVSLRRTSFPEDVLALELAWANQSCIEALMSSVENGESLYGLTIIIEELRRNKREIPDLSVNIEHHSLLAQARFLSSLSGTKHVSEERLVAVATDLLLQDVRDRPAVDLAYFCLSQALLRGTDKRRLRIPWWANKVHLVIMAIRGLVGSCISGTDDETKKEAAMYVSRIWKVMADSLTAEKMYRITKSLASMAGEYIRLSGKISSSECASVLDRGCCVLLSKLSQNERNYLHALLGKSDRETLKRIIELLDRNYKYKGKV